MIDTLFLEKRLTQVKSVNTVESINRRKTAKETAINTLDIAINLNIT